MVNKIGSKIFQNSNEFRSVYMPKRLKNRKKRNPTSCILVFVINISGSVR